MRHFIHHQPIIRSKIATGERGISTGKITLSFIRGSLRVGLLAVSVAMRVALALSYMTITCHIAYNTLSHVCFLTFWESDGEVRGILVMGSSDHFTDSDL